MSRFDSPETDMLLEEMAEMRSSTTSDRVPTAYRSFNNQSVGGSSSNSNASSSKAVLAALKALQEKIRRLESEKTLHMDEVNALRHQLKSQEIEAEHVRQRDNLSHQKGLQELKMIIERQNNEIIEKDSRQLKVEDRLKEQARLYASLNEKLVVLEEEKESALLRSKELETAHRLLESQSTRGQQREKDLTDTLTREISRRDTQIQMLTQTLGAKTAQLSRLEDTVSNHMSKIEQLNQFVKKVLGINERLVGRLGAVNPTPPVSRPFAVTNVNRSRSGSIPKKAPTPNASGIITLARRGRISASEEAEYYRDMQEGLGEEYSKLKGTRAKSSPKRVKKSKGTAMTRRVGEVAVEGAPRRLSVHVPGLRRAEEAQALESPDKSRYYSIATASMMMDDSSSRRQRDHLQSLILSVEEEHRSLSETYRELSEGARRGADVGGGGDDIVSVLQKLQKKEQQLEALRGLITAG